MALTTHVHAAVDQELRPCPACLLRMQTRGAHLFVNVAPLAVPDLDRFQAASDPSFEPCFLCPRDARGPPLS